MGGPIPSVGRVEIYHSKHWGTVCADYDWDLSDANVVCRQLGYELGAEMALKGMFGSSARRIWLDQLKCRGTEPSIAMCPHRTWGVTSCYYSSDAEVFCKTKNDTLYGECTQLHCGEQEVHVCYLVIMGLISKMLIWYGIWCLADILSISPLVTDTKWNKPNK